MAGTNQPRQDPGDHALYAGRQDITIGGGCPRRCISTRSTMPIPASSAIGRRFSWTGSRPFRESQTSPPISGMQDIARHHHQARSRFELRHPALRHRQYPRRRFRPAHRLHDVYHAKSVPCRPGGQPKSQHRPEALNGIYVKSSSGQQVPLSTLVDSVLRSGAARRQPSGPVPFGHDLVQSLPDTAIGQAVSAIQQVEKELGKPLRPDELSGQRPGIEASLSSTPILIAAGTLRHLPHPRRALREPRPPHHHHLDPAVGRPRRAAAADGGCAADLRRDRDRRRHPAHRHRQEQHAACWSILPGASNTTRGLTAGGSIYRACAPALWTDPDDHHGGAARRRADDGGSWSTGRTPPPLGYAHRRRLVSVARS